jgi:hypothetical protein
MSKENTSLVSMDIVAMNGKEEVIKLYDTTLIKHTEEIQKFRDAGNLAILAIANELRTIEDDKSYEKAGFKNVAEYANVIFDYKRPTVSIYVRVARAFISKSEDGKYQFNGNLPNMTVGQMMELLPLVKDGTNIEAVLEKFEDGTLNSRMSSKKIRQEVNHIIALGAPEVEATSIEDAKEEKTDAIKNAAKLNLDKLPKGYDEIKYATEILTAMAEMADNVAKAIIKIDDNQTMLAKVESITKAIAELSAEVASK